MLREHRDARDCVITVTDGWPFRLSRDPIKRNVYLLYRQVVYARARARFPDAYDGFNNAALCAEIAFSLDARCAHPSVHRYSLTATFNIRAIREMSLHETLGIFEIRSLVEKGQFLSTLMRSFFRESSS